jgi:predicted benzoate:H+ symporter BenE
MARGTSVFGKYRNAAGVVIEVTAAGIEFFKVKGAGFGPHTTFTLTGLGQVLSLGGFEKVVS